MRRTPFNNVTREKAQAFIFVLTVDVAGVEMYYAAGHSEFKMNALYDRVSACKDMWSLWLCAESDPNRDKLLRTTNPNNGRLLAPPTQNPADDQQEHRSA